MKISYTLRDIAPPVAASSSELTESVWLLNLDHVEPHTGRLLERRKVSTDQVGTSTQPFDTGNVLYSKLRPYLNKVYLPNDYGYCTSEFVPLRPRFDLVTREYLAAYLRSARFVSWVSSQVAGAKMPRVSMKTFWEHTLELPSLPEQQRITAILDKADSARHKREQAIRLADDFLRATFLEMFGDPVMNPKGWPIGTIRDLVASANYGTSKKARETEGAFPILRMNNLTYSGRMDLSSLKYVDLDPSEAPKYLACRGDLLFNRTNSKELVGKTAVYERDEPMAIAGYLVRVRTNERGTPHYLSAYLNSAHGKQVLQSKCKSIIGMANINAQELQNIQIMIPPRALQDRYAEIVERTREFENRLTASLEQLESIKASLSHRLFC